MHKPPPSDKDLELLEQAIGRDALAVAMGVARCTVDTWIRAAKSRDSRMGKTNLYAADLAADLRKKQRKDARTTADLASRIDLSSMRAVVRVFDELVDGENKVIDPKTILEVGRFAHDVQCSGHYTRRAGRASGAAHKSHDELLDKVRKATASAAAKHAKNVLPFERPEEVGS